MTPTYYHPTTQAYFTRGDAFTLEGVNHPAEKWADSEAITAMGLVPVVDVGTPADPRYFVNTEELVGAERRVVSTPKDPAVVEADAAADVEGKKVLIRGVREGYLNRLSGIAFAAQLSGDTATTTAFLLVRQGLLDMTKDLPTNPELIDAEVVKRYGALLLLCTPEMMAAFAKVDA